MLLILLTTLVVGTLSAPAQQSLTVHEDGSYKFYYETGKEGGQHSRSEVRHPDGVVEGKYSYEDANGDIREVVYRADDSGYVANGDVGVEGAPKSQFPAPKSTFDNEPPPTDDNASLNDTESGEKDSQLDMQDPTEPSTDAEEKHFNLDAPTIEEDPPEGFPQGFFLQHFKGLRRLPEPTKEEPSSTERDEATMKTEEPEMPPKKNRNEQLDQPDEVVTKPDLTNKISNDMKLIMELRPFRSFSHQRLDSEVFPQPVYVFSYQNPDSYGYQYFF